MMKAKKFGRQGQGAINIDSRSRVTTTKYELQHRPLRLANECFIFAVLNPSSHIVATIYITLYSEADLSNSLKTSSYVPDNIASPLQISVS
jgi:hypothetical protein